MRLRPAAESGSAPVRELNLKIVYLDPASLKPDPRNPRTHGKKQTLQIAGSILAYGFTNPILIDENGVVIAGHGRLLAAKHLGLTSVPTITIRGLTERQKQALRIADNKIAQNAGWDSELLAIHIGELALDVDFDFSVIGFSSGEIDVIQSDKPRDTEDDIVPAAPVRPVAKLGDIWRLGDHRLICGDCRDPAVLAKLMQDELADAAFVDPPYNVKINGNAVGRGTHKEFEMASGEMSPAQFIAFLTRTLGNCTAVSRTGAVHFACMDHKHVAELSAAGDAVYGARLNICVWVKSNGGMGSLYRSRHEFVFVYRVGDGPYFNAVELGKHGRNRTNVWEYDGVNTLKGSRRGDLNLHPTVKPIQLVADAIMDVTQRGDLILDAFVGSGTSLLACERVGRRFRGAEISPAYVDVALERWAAMTGREPVHEGSGMSFSERRGLASAEARHGE